MRFESEGSLPTRTGRPLLRSGLKLGQVTLTEAIGKGGMGEVWKAFDATRDAHVALKFLPSEVQDSSREMRRVVQTFRAVQALQHPHICPVYFLEEFPSFGQVLGMKFIDGLTLVDYRDQYFDEHGKFPVEELVRILRPVAEALDYAHNPSAIHPEVTKAVIHRDIKPENILIGADGRGVQIVDFGLVEQVRMSVSRVSQVEMDSSGTRPYMAPEQWRGQFQDGCTDQYALAVVAYELLADRLPFEVADPFQLRECVLNEPVESISDVPGSVNAALLKALSKDRDDRFGTCTEFVDALAVVSVADSINVADHAEPASEMAVDQASTTTPPPTKPPRPDSGSRLADHVRSMQTRADTAHREARQLMDEAHDYAAAAEILSEFSEELRDEYLYQTAVSRRDRVRELESEITAAVQSMRLSGMRSRVNELLELTPDRIDMQELLETLPAKAPPLLVAPFDADTARRRQEEWAEFLKRPVEWETSIGMKFRLIPPGEFLMGSPDSEKGHSDDEMQHRVRITKPFYCGCFPVTQREYEKVVSSNPSYFKAGFIARLFGANADGKDMSRHPIEVVNWADAEQFLASCSSSLVSRV
ncbi:MAG: protein kinase [Rhodopirellula sp.]|nr:protein kinase [Rhodopirellula sp.]